MMKPLGVSFVPLVTLLIRIPSQCNNPLTKEPKLDRARRQVPEWEKYDNEVAAFQKKLNSRAAKPTESDTATASQPSSDDTATFKQEPIEQSGSPEDLVEVFDILGADLPPSSNGETARDEL